MFVFLDDNSPPFVRQPLQVERCLVHGQVLFMAAAVLQHKGNRLHQRLVAVGRCQRQEAQAVEQQRALRLIGRHHEGKVIVGGVSHVLVALREQLCRLALDGAGDPAAALGIRGTRLEGLEHVAQRGDEFFRPQAMLSEIALQLLGARGVELSHFAQQNVRSIVQRLA